MKLETTIQNDQKTVRVLTRIKGDMILTSLYDCNEDGACKSWSPFREIEASVKKSTTTATLKRQHQKGEDEAMWEFPRN